MLERTDWGHQVTCDTCEKSEDIQTNDFRMAVAIVKKRGWRIYKDGEDWCHMCPKCRKAEYQAGRTGEYQRGPSLSGPDTRFILGWECPCGAKNPNVPFCLTCGTAKP